MGQLHATEEIKKGHRQRHKTKEHLFIGELELDMETAKTKMQFYQQAMNIINDLAKELTGIDLLKKTGDDLEQAEEQLEKTVYIYNEKRPHWSNHFLTPNEMHQ